MSDDSKSRLDLWLWSARLFKTRSLAKNAVEGGRVEIGGARVKPGRPVKLGDRITITRDLYRLEVIVDGLARRRGSATVAQTLYHETEASIEARTRAVASRRLSNAGLTPPASRPDRRARRAIKSMKEGAADDL